MNELSEIIRFGNSLYHDVMTVDAEKAGVAMRDVEARLGGLFQAFCRQAGLAIEVQIRFCDVHALMKRHSHTQLSVVYIESGRCTLNFHTYLLSTSDPNAGLVFAARSWTFLVVLADALARGLDRKTGFVFEIGDNGGLDSVAHCSNNMQACLILDCIFMASSGYEPFRNECARTPLDWNERIDRVFWRGSTTGRRLKGPPPMGAPDDLKWLRRLQLCQAARDPAIESFCDVGLSEIVQIAEPHLRDNIVAANFLKGPVPREYFRQQKFVIDIDGNSNSWSGLFCSLLGGSCVLKVASAEGYRQWFYPSLAPWREYAPVSADLSDFAEAVAWVRGNDAKARDIADRGREVAEKMTLEAAIAASSANLIAWLRQET